MTNFRTGWIIALILIGILLLMVTLLTYYLRQFLIRRKELFISKRYPLKVRNINIGIILSLIFHRILITILYFSALSEKIYHYLSWIEAIIYVIFGYGITYLCICRYWLMWYDLNYSNSIINKQWIVYLNPSKIKKDFWLKYKPVLGNSIQMNKILFIPFIISSIIYLLTFYFTNGHLQKNNNNNLLIIIIDFIIYIPPLILLILIIFNCPKELDIFMLRKEISILLFISLLCGGTLFLGKILIYIFCHDNGNYYNDDQYVDWKIKTIAIVSGHVWPFALSCLLTVTMLKLIDKTTHNTKGNNHKQHQPIPSRSSRSNKNNNNNNNFKSKSPRSKSKTKSKSKSKSKTKSKTKSSKTRSTLLTVFKSKTTSTASTTSTTTTTTTTTTILSSGSSDNDGNISYGFDGISMDDDDDDDIDDDDDEYDDDDDIIGSQQDLFDDQWDLQSAILHPRLSELFIHHLCREYSIELILSFIEFVQFKHVVHEYFQIDTGLNGDTPMMKFYNYSKCDITFNQSIPKSDTVYNQFIVGLLNQQRKHRQHNNNKNKNNNNDNNHCQQQELQPQKPVKPLISPYSKISNTNISDDDDDESDDDDHDNKEEEEDDNKEENEKLNVMKEFLRIAHKLYKKYIEENSELEVNISGLMRDTYYNDMHNKDKFIENFFNQDMNEIDLFEHFDVVIEEMYHCMLTAFDRFNDSDQRVAIAKIQLRDVNSTKIRDMYKARN